MSSMNNNIFENIQVTSQEYIILKSIENFYENSNNVNNFLKILNGYIEDKNNIDLFTISIRLIDYFVTKYSKNNKICYKITNNNLTQTINVYISYKQQLKIFQKKNFDPFSRGYRIPYFLNDTCIITTISQLNFFKWFFTNGLYDYILKHRAEIELEMNSKNKIKLKTKKNIISKKKVQLYNNQNSIIPPHNYNTNNIVVTFTI